ncbi:hypothetical protein ACZ90_14260 [Streptomyces albus subsp. albus]|nr:hypothetical protein ACZ90_14260 [Streptomyces albus subsp. albus]
MTARWPVTELDPVRRLRVMAAGLGAAMYAEEHIDAPFAEVWAVASDLERELPHLVPTMTAFRMEDGAAAGPGGRRTARAYGPLGYRARFEVLLQPGWCLMQSRCVVGGMAAVAEGGGTRFAVLGSLRSRTSGLLQDALRPLGEARGHVMIARARHRTRVRGRR